jgi:phosphopantothenoylcysteine decarboxylase/phosphopantothenate--cysteine ligase
LVFLHNFFKTSYPLAGKKALVTAGPTYEPIDPVRFIGNHSSGKMGYALAEELARNGAAGGAGFRAGGAAAGA